MENLIIVHAHQYKNAGSTIEWSLEKNFGKQFRIIDKTPTLWNDPAELNSIINREISLKAISAHWVNLRHMDEWAFQPFPFLMMRHPLERARSVYNFERKQEGGGTGASVAKQQSFRGYVEWSMADPVHSVVQNHQTRHCSGKILANLSDEDVKSAAQLLDRIPIVGVVDLYDETMVLLEDRLSQRGLDIDMSYIRQNVTQQNILSAQDKVTAVKDELGDLFSKLEDDNHYDLSLYESSRRRLLEQCNELTDFGDRLVHFRSRCAALSEPSEGAPTQEPVTSSLSVKYWLQKIGRR